MHIHEDGQFNYNSRCCATKMLKTLLYFDINYAFSSKICKLSEDFILAT